MNTFIFVKIDAWDRYALEIPGHTTANRFLTNVIVAFPSVCSLCFAVHKPGKVLPNVTNIIVSGDACFNATDFLIIVISICEIGTSPLNNISAKAYFSGSNC